MIVRPCHRRRLAAAAVLVLAMSGPALAQSSTASKSGDWEFAATAYLWGSGLDGSIGIGDVPATSVDASFSELWSVLDIGLMAAFEARRNRWGVVVDAVYIELSDSEPTPGQAFGDAKLEVTQQTYSFAAAYRVVEGKVALDVDLGARYWDLSPELSLSPGTQPGRVGSRSVSWWDGFAGARVLYTPTEHWRVVGYADIGAGGSEMQWQVLAGAGYQFNKSISLDFGYRYLNVDYDDDAFVYDVAMAGPYVGVGFRF